MKGRRLLFRFGQASHRPPASGDVLAVILLAILLYMGLRLALDAPAVMRGPSISLSRTALPWYAVLSTGRMTAAYALSMLFTLFYGRYTAYHPRAEKILLPLLDVMQSVPILSFLPLVLLSFSAVLPQNLAAELGSVFLIFTSQAWNLTFCWYQSLTTLPEELREASAVYRLGSWLRLRYLEVPFGMISLIWNSIMSWAGGWFFLMAAEIFTVGHRDFRLPGLGSYLQEAAEQADYGAIAWGLGMLVFVIVALDQFVWRPLQSWADRFKLETIEGQEAPGSWFYDALRRARLTGWVGRRVVRPVSEALDERLARPSALTRQAVRRARLRRLGAATAALLSLTVLCYQGFRAGTMMLEVSAAQWGTIAVGLGATLARVLVALLITCAWAVPVGVAIGTSKGLASRLGPVVQVLASIPATALFPIFLLFVLRLPGGLSSVAVLLMLAGTQWYMLFNVIAGASSIPEDLKYTTQLLGVGPVERWRRMILPALFPYLVTGAITATGGAWNASIVAEHVQFGGKVMSTVGIGASIANATTAGNYPVLLAATLSMVVLVVLLNRTAWHRLYSIAEQKYRLE